LAYRYQDVLERAVQAAAAITEAAHSSQRGSGGLSDQSDAVMGMYAF